MPKLPKILSRGPADPSRIFQVESLELRFSNGVERRYERLENHGVGAVIVVPVTENGEAILVREYACGLHRYEVGLPKGRLERGESVLDGANREMKEEIGYGARRLQVLRSLTLAPAYMSHQTHAVLAQDLYPESLEGDEPETLETLRWPLDRLEDLVFREDVSEGRSIAALFLARERLRNAS